MTRGSTQQGGDQGGLISNGLGNPTYVPPTSSRSSSSSKVNFAIKTLSGCNVSPCSQPMDTHPQNDDHLSCAATSPRFATGDQLSPAQRTKHELSFGHTCRHTIGAGSTEHAFDRLDYMLLGAGAKV